MKDIFKYILIAVICFLFGAGIWSFFKSEEKPMEKHITRIDTMIAMVDTLNITAKYVNHIDALVDERTKLRIKISEMGLRLAELQGRNIVITEVVHDTVLVDSSNYFKPIEYIFKETVTIHPDSFSQMTLMTVSPVPLDSIGLVNSYIDYEAHFVEKIKPELFDRGYYNQTQVSVIGIGLLALALLL